MLDTKPLLAGKGFPKLKRDSLEILQVNLGYKCNLSKLVNLKALYIGSVIYDGDKPTYDYLSTFSFDLPP